MPRAPTLRAVERAARARRGQAMVEYSSINVFAIIGLCFAISSRVFGNNKNLIDLFLEAYQVYYDSFYFLLNLPIP